MLSQLELGDHVCWQVGDDRSWFDHAAAFVRHGAAANHRVVFLAAAPDAVLAGLTARDVAADALIRSGQLDVCDAVDAYRPDAPIDTAAQVDRLRDTCARFQAEGYDGVRIIADRRWAARWILDAGAARAVDVGSPRLAALADYEAAINDVTADGYAAAVCIYDEGEFTQAGMRAVTMAHPATLTSGSPVSQRPLLRIRRPAPLHLQLIGDCDLSNQAAVAGVLAALSRTARDTGRPATVDVSHLQFADLATVRMLLAAEEGTPAGLSIAGHNQAIRSLAGLLRRT